MVETLKEQLLFAVSRLSAGASKMKCCKAYKIRSNRDDFDKFCDAAADIFAACDAIERIKDQCIVELESHG
jgi:hypothetical protein